MSFTFALLEFKIQRISMNFSLHISLRYELCCVGSSFICTKVSCSVDLYQFPEAALPMLGCVCSTQNAGQNLFFQRFLCQKTEKKSSIKDQLSKGSKKKPRMGIIGYISSQQ